MSASPTPKGHPYWIVALTQPCREKWAAENVARQGHAFYLPLVEKTLGKGVRSTTITVPLFPSYLFVEFSGQWHFLLSTFGVRGVCTPRGDGAPGQIRTEIIDDIRVREDRRGLIRLPKVKSEPFDNGQKVAITQGPFTGQIGVYEGQTDQQRQMVLLNFLGGQVKALFAKEELKAA